MQGNGNDYVCVCVCVLMPVKQLKREQQGAAKREFQGLRRKHDANDEPTDVINRYLLLIVG